jgi:hypothetical protein
LEAASVLMSCDERWINERLFEGLGKGNAGLAVAGMCLMKGADGVSRSSECKQGQTQVTTHGQVIWPTQFRAPI